MGSARCAVCSVVSSDVPGNNRMKGLPAQSTLFTFAALVLMQWMICAHLHIIAVHIKCNYIKLNPAQAQPVRCSPI